MGREHEISIVKLRNVAGIPVIEIIGVLNRNAVSMLEKTISHLAGAGHYNIVLNVKKAIAPDLSCLESLAECVKKVRNHYGAVQLVAEAWQITQISVGGTLAGVFKFCASEGQAFQRIKGLVRPDDTSGGAEMHLREKV